MDILIKLWYNDSVSFNGCESCQDLVWVSGKEYKSIKMKNPLKAVVGSSYDCEKITVELHMERIFDPNLISVIKQIGTDVFSSSEIKIKGLKKVKVIDPYLYSKGNIPTNLSGVIAAKIDPSLNFEVPALPSNSNSLLAVPLLGPQNSTHRYLYLWST